MKKLLLLIVLTSLLFSSDCTKEFSFVENSSSYQIHVFDYITDSEIEDLSLEAKMYLFVKIKEKFKKRIYALELKNFEEINSYKCDGTLHAIFQIDKDNIHFIYTKDLEDDALSYRDIRKKILKKIAFIEVKETLTLVDYQKLYPLYFSLGKISDVNRIMDKIIELKWSN